MIADTGDCSGLKDFSINQPNQPSTREPYPGAIQYVFPVAVAENTLPGLLPQSSVTLRDTMDNEATFPLRVYYDPPNIAGVANAGAPVLAEGGTLVVSSPNALQRTVTIRATVNDTIYNQATGKPFASVLVAAVKGGTPLAPSEVATSSLTWSSIAMPSAGAAEINFKYALNTNSKAPALVGAEGTYYLYVKFIDGAGNASTGTLISGPVRLAAGYTAIETFLPNVSR